MWCKHCRQDTPSISAAGRNNLCCGRCGRALDDQRPATQKAASVHPAEIGLDLKGLQANLGTSFDDWRLDQDIRSLQSRIAPGHQTAAARREPTATSRQPQWRVDAAHAARRTPHKPKRKPADRPGPTPTFTNSALLIGLLACIGGVAVLGWSVIEARGDLWNIGLSAAVAGGVVFLMGLVLQLERIWHNSRVAVQKLRQIDSHLADLERTTSLLGVTHGSASQAFYAHMVERANPHLLLSDLKGQIDLLAMRMAER